MTPEVCDTLLQTVRRVLTLSPSLLLLRSSSWNVRQVIMYVYCAAIIFKRKEADNAPAQPDDVCAICGEPFDDPAGEKRFTLPCKHTMHAECMCTYVQHTKYSQFNESLLSCPYCKADVVAGMKTKLASCGHALPKKPEETAHSTENDVVASMLRFADEHYK